MEYKSPIGPKVGPQKDKKPLDIRHQTNFFQTIKQRGQDIFGL